MSIDARYSNEAFDNAADANELAEQLDQELLARMRSASDPKAGLSAIVSDLEAIGHHLAEVSSSGHRIVFRADHEHGCTLTLLYGPHDRSVRARFSYRRHMGASIDDLCPWTGADGGVQATVKAFLDSADLSVTDLFGKKPKVLVHRGDVHVEKGFATYAQGNGVFVIDGSLNVAGPLVFTASDLHTVLIVTGNLHATQLAQISDTQLGVGGTTTVDGLLWLDVSDAGFSVFRGPVSSRDRFVGARSAAQFEQGVTGRFLEEPGLDTDAVLAALAEGKSPV
ncbi:hypothetical protein AKJ09_05015 [Labilithrix luteola]|uniref:Uncharacterized protein n=1 Tax=Labilithrix luteola TaxID=1391654 RepID=A0A0K1PY98_9BACT|nr:hypothetical protein [Labilithrix luteola]AKU98351.1 hypothetical protein AKJ09_05015 [Labilithrix luteola]